jgi:hypothetical protein
VGREQVPSTLFFQQGVKSPAMSVPTVKLPDSDPIIERLEDQVAWYDSKSMANQRAYKRIKVVEILAAVIIPFSGGSRASAHRDGDRRPGCISHRARRNAAFEPIPAELDQLSFHLRSVEAWEVIHMHFLRKVSSRMKHGTL